MCQLRFNSRYFALQSKYFRPTQSGNVHLIRTMMDERIEPVSVKSYHIYEFLHRVDKVSLNRVLFREQNFKLQHMLYDRAKMAVLFYTRQRELLHLLRTQDVSNSRNPSLLLGRILTKQPKVRSRSLKMGINETQWIRMCQS